VVTVPQPSDVVGREQPSGVVHAAPQQGDGHLVLDGVRKEYHRKGHPPVVACDSVSLSVSRGEFVVLLGPSGCGKTTLLRIIAGLDKPDAGRIAIDGNPVYDGASGVAVPPEKRGIGMVFQSYALWPHMTVFDNVAYPLRARRVPKAQIAQRVRDVLALTDVRGAEHRLPSQLSGGQQQRVALSRALVGGSDIILFDEPLSNVDAKVRNQLRDELQAMHEKVHFTAVYVTHDQQEALSLASRLLVLDEGRVLQDAPPDTVYRRPSSLPVARFIGTADELSGRLLEHQQGTAVVETEVGRLRGTAPGSLSGDDVTVIVRPTAWQISEDGPAAANDLTGTVVKANFQGERLELSVTVGNGVLRVWAPQYSQTAVGDEVRLTAPESQVMVYGSV
jgi:iron(III) transport system ATP-binding protein